ncbi:protein FAM210A-like [Saccostrea cucullata]|uniref:protein FAM210A-like n=1 Tax=Saccostrea cuccullata TaxID=36930 RepID=UPI002ED4B2B6
MIRQGGFFARRILFSSLRNGCFESVSCYGYMSNCQSVTRFSTEVTKYRQWSLPRKLQLYQPFKTLSQSTENATKATAVETEKLSVFKRFKQTYKEHGKVLVGVHLVTSLVWYGSFYLILSSGFDLPGFLEKVDWNARVVKPLNFIGIEVSLERIEKFVQVMKTSGSYAGAYLMYKIATPARYTVTLGGTNMAIKYLRKSGKIPPVKEADKLGHLMKESKVELEARMKSSVAQGRKRYDSMKAKRLGNKKQGQLLMKAQEFYKKRNGSRNGTMKTQDKWLTKAREFYKNRKKRKSRPS